MNRIQVIGGRHGLTCRWYVSRVTACMEGLCYCHGLWPQNSILGNLFYKYIFMPAWSNTHTRSRNNPNAHNRGLLKHMYIHVMEYQAVTKKKTLTSKLSRDVRRLTRTVNTSTWYGQDVTLWAKMRGKIKTLHLSLFVYAWKKYGWKHKPPRSEVMGVRGRGGFAVWTGGPRAGRRHSTV